MFRSIWSDSIGLVGSELGLSFSQLITLRTAFDSPSTKALARGLMTTATLGGAGAALGNRADLSS